MMNAATATERPPDAQLIFSEGDYGHALRCYYAAKEWVLFTGQCFRRDLYGTIGRPAHPQCPAEESIVPPELIDEPGWTMTVDLWVENDEVLNWLETLALPKHSRLKMKEDE